MSSVVNTKTRGPDLSELKKLLGPPPVLASENLEAYDTILSRLMEAMKPDDFLVETLVVDLADLTWEIIRYKRHKTLVVERKRLGQQQAQEYWNKRRRERLDARPLERRTNRWSIVGPRCRRHAGRRSLRSRRHARDS